jgi:ATP-dependent exoDNAse (exonuclease V) alpha subunit
MTLDRLLNQLDRRTDQELTTRSVVVVDEAGMVGTRKLTQLLEHAQAAGAKVVLVGDHHQLTEIDAGGAFASFVHRLDASLLLDNHRQQEPWERSMLVDLRAGEVGNIVDTLIEHDRVHFAEGPEEAMAAMVADWLGARAGGGRVLMMAQRLSEVERLNELARAQLQATGEVGPDVLVAGGRGFAEGDHVMALRNDYIIGILNGTRGIIELIDADRGTIALNDGRGTVDVPLSYVADGDLTHGYAVTFHKTQGLTVDRSLTLATGGLTREVAYTALSRGIDRNDLYGAELDARFGERHFDEVSLDPRQQLRAALEHTAAETVAFDQPRTRTIEHDFGLGL